MSLDDFIRIRDIRLPNAAKAIGLLGNLGAKRYGAMASDKRAIVDALYDAVDAVADQFGIPPAEAEPEAAQAAPEGEGGPLTGSAREDVAWALDMLKRGEVEDCVTMLKRALTR